jgi:hypothetical protein
MKCTTGVVATLMILSLTALAFRPKTEITFHTLLEAKTRLLTLGVHCTSDRANGQLDTGLLVSRSAVTWSEAGSLRKIGRMGPQWKGKVWVTVNPQRWELQTVPDDASVRVWGDIVAFGDAEFLNEIDEALSRSEG